MFATSTALFKEAIVSTPTLNSFCRKFDLVFVETGQENGKEVFWFVDFDNRRRFYTEEEIVTKLGL